LSNYTNSDYNLGWKHAIEWAEAHQKLMLPHVVVRNNLTKEVIDSWEHSCSGMIRTVMDPKIKPELEIEVRW
jgi:hypothetical protein